MFLSGLDLKGRSPNSGFQSKSELTRVSSEENLVTLKLSHLIKSN